MKTPHSVIKHPISTEKVMRLMESENKLAFVVDRKATKSKIKKELEETFKIKITRINTVITPQGKKKAYVRLSPETPAIDVATQLGLM
ncbi:MAG: 50S ribosomal protein L23 [Nanoarchaeota archaeon]|nr:50S ribosomal protein L23 [Nanoarchaeota archaeon]